MSKCVNIWMGVEIFDRGVGCSESDMVFFVGREVRIYIRVLRVREICECVVWGCKVRECVMSVW